MPYLMMAQLENKRGISKCMDPVPVELLEDGESVVVTLKDCQNHAYLRWGWFLWVYLVWLFFLVDAQGNAVPTGWHAVAVAGELCEADSARDFQLQKEVFLPHQHGVQREALQGWGGFQNWKNHLFVLNGLFENFLQDGPFSVLVAYDGQLWMASPKHQVKDPWVRGSWDYTLLYFTLLCFTLFFLLFTFWLFTLFFLWIGGLGK